MIDNGYISYMNIRSLQELIDKLVIWYEIKEPNRELGEREGIYYTDFNDLKNLSDEMTMQQLLFRLSSKENSFLKGMYRTGVGGIRYDKEKGKYIPELYVTFRRIEKEDKPMYYRNEYGIYFDGVNGKITNFYSLPCELNLEDDMTIEKLLVILGKLNNFDLKNIKKCIKFHETDLKLRDLILQYTALKLMYSKNTIPEYGYERAKKFLEEFNTYFKLNLNSKEIDSLMNKDYSLNESEKYFRLENNELNKLVHEQKRMVKSMTR